jgi:hypothetical protein
VKRGGSLDGEEDEGCDDDGDDDAVAVSEPSFTWMVDEPV